MTTTYCPATGGSAAVVRGNALDLPLADAAVDLVVTSPPYFGLRSYQDAGEHYAGQIGAEATPAEFVDALIAATAEMVRVLKPSGSIWVNLGDKYAGAPSGPLKGCRTEQRARQRPTYSRPGTRKTRESQRKSLIGIPWRYAIRCIDDLGLILRAEVIWSKPNGLPESVTDRVRRSHEVWFHFTKEPRYFSAVDEIREGYAPTTDAWRRLKDRRSGEIPGYTEHVDQVLGGGHTGLNDRSEGNPLGKLPGSVWSIPTQPLQVPAELGIDHFAAFPMEWPRRIISGWSPKDGLVLDPFGGTGTTALLAKVLGRHGVSIDMSSDYCRLAEWRTADPKQLDKARSKVLDNARGGSWPVLEGVKMRGR